MQIYYEPRLTKLDLNNIEIENLASEFEDIPEDEEDLDSREKNIRDTPAIKVFLSKNSSRVSRTLG